MPNPPVRLKVLLREKHWQTHHAFCGEYDKAAKSIDPKLVQTWPSRAQFHRWMNGELKGLPYPHHCRVLETMLPGWTAEQLFELCPPEESSQPASSLDEPMAADVAELLATIEHRIDAPKTGEISWGATTRAIPAAKRRLQTLAGSPIADPSDHAHELGRRLLELQKARRLNDVEITELAGLSGHVIELTKRVDIEIAPDGGAVVDYRFDLLNLGDKPQARMSREVWFEHTTGPLVIKPVPDMDRRVAIQRIHDTTNLAKFAFQISPPLRPGGVGPRRLHHRTRQVRREPLLARVDASLLPSLRDPRPPTRHRPGRLHSHRRTSGRLGELSHR
ncbi:hypothetical protein [Actinomadura rudentiformis]|uniref:Uncharacterized protein n=1 Tax=Actinomadura rudentiformis TaxID=359158 RepID=A0A6H9Z0K8_9ACTN|nr:hypothetical protein [Actinomadura rudentiformis]KAB2347976.1 hypothetical protein F8566_19055 [Actinomadura rudentiformis]